MKKKQNKLLEHHKKGTKKNKNAKKQIFCVHPKMQITT